MKYTVREISVREIVVEARANASDDEVIAYVKNEVNVVENVLYEPSYVVYGGVSSDG